MGSEAVDTMPEEVLCDIDHAEGQKHLSEVARTRQLGEVTAAGVDHLYGLVVKVVESNPEHEPIRAKMEVMHQVILGCVQGSEDTPFVHLPEAEEEFVEKNEDFKLAIEKMCTQLDDNGCASTAELLRRLLAELEEMGGLDLLNKLLNQGLAGMKAMKAWLQRALKQALNTWIDWYDHMMRQQEIARKAMARWINQKMTAAFNSWCDWYEEVMRQKAFLAKCMARWMKQALAKAFNQWFSVTDFAGEEEPEPEPEPEPVILVVKQPRARSPVRLVVQDTRKDLGKGYWCVYGETYGIGIAEVPHGSEPNFEYTSMASGSPDQRGSPGRSPGPNLMRSSMSGMLSSPQQAAPMNQDSYAEQLQANSAGGTRMSPGGGGALGSSPVRGGGGGARHEANIQLVHCTQNTLTVKWPCYEPQARAFPHTLLISANGVEFKPVTVVNAGDREELQHTMTGLRAGTSYVIRVDVGGHLKYWNTLQTLAKTGASPARSPAAARSPARSPAQKSRFEPEASRFNYTMQASHRG